MKSRSQRYGLKFEQIFTQQVFDWLKQEKSFRMRLDTMKLEELPEIVTIPPYKCVTYGIHHVKIVGEPGKTIKAVIIKDFTDLIFPFSWLNEYNYLSLLAKIKFEYNKN